ncbi:hypothetical protein ACLOJK_005537 [Asimina triloba]
MQGHLTVLHHPQSGWQPRRHRWREDGRRRQASRRMTRRRAAGVALVSGGSDRRPAVGHGNPPIDASPMSDRARSNQRWGRARLRSTTTDCHRGRQLQAVSTTSSPLTVSVIFPSVVRHVPSDHSHTIVIRRILQWIPMRQISESTIAATPQVKNPSTFIPPSTHQQRAGRRSDGERRLTGSWQAAGRRSDGSHHHPRLRSAAAGGEQLLEAMADRRAAGRQHERTSGLGTGRQRDGSQATALPMRGFLISLL